MCGEHSRARFVLVRTFRDSKGREEGPFLGLVLLQLNLSGVEFFLISMD